jgi:hypothetical protein
MQTRIYESRQDQKRRAYAAYSSGDMEAGQIVDADVREYMRELFTRPCRTPERIQAAHGAAETGKHGPTLCGCR